MTTLLEWDKKLLVAINSYHWQPLDPVMYYLSQTWFWLPLYFFLLWLVIRHFGKNSWVVLAGIALAVVLADQITASLMKPYFARLRPSHEPALENILHFVTDYNGELYKGGLYGFASSHAANTFATATFFLLLYRQRYRWVVALFAWAILMTYTRLYLGVHYPGDILVGASIGVASGWTGHRLTNWIMRMRGIHQPA